MRSTILLLFILMLLPAFSASGFEVKNSVISSGSNPDVKATVGQPIAGEITKSKAGFWHVINILGPYFDQCDFNQDGKIDIKDMQRLSAHYGIKLSGDLGQYDLNEDGEVNRLDLEIFRVHW